MSAQPGVDTRGLVALGDSITRGSGEAMLGLRMQSWALWLAEALCLPYTCLARDGARAPDALRSQIPRLNGPYALACVYLGVNDVRDPAWDGGEFAHAYEQTVARVAGHARTLLLAKLPREIGVPPAPRGAIEQANRTIELSGERNGALVLELDSLHGSELVLPDRVHLTARGQAHLALLAHRRLSAAADAHALDVLAADRHGGLADLHEALRPLSQRARLRYLLGAHALAQLRDWRRRALESMGWGW
ncbi:MAG TPA: GDSL-type esterase/lipase family protein [Solirubrobacteraceae bacterium]|nr:GDSL-type esterase/lipase family protein [Solirubrobacteraceae bacterium]